MEQIGVPVERQVLEEEVQKLINRIKNEKDQDEDLVGNLLNDSEFGDS